MTEPSYRVFLVEDDEDDFVLIRDMLREVKAASFSLEWSPDYHKAIEAMDRNEHDLFLVDYRLGKQTGLEWIKEARERGCLKPMIMLTGQDDYEIDMEAMRAGAADYLVKGKIGAPLLERAIRYAVEQNRMKIILRDMSWTDELTGLYNRRGFFAFAERQLKLSARSAGFMTLIFADVDGLKQINDKFGHREGDIALQAVAGILRECFRDTDILGRISGDEFAALLIDSGSSSPSARVTLRLREMLKRRKRQYVLSLSLGVVSGNSAESASLDELVSRADERMYEEKRKKKEEGFVVVEVEVE